MERSRKGTDAGTLGKIAILGGGNIGSAMARGFVQSGDISAGDVIVTRRQVGTLEPLRRLGCTVHSDNIRAVREASMVIVAVRPRQMQGLLRQITPALKPGRHVLISTVTGVSIATIRQLVGEGIWIVRAMPNTAVAVRESMTCISAPGLPENIRHRVVRLFRLVGETVEIDEEYMTPATALCACGVAFFLRAIRAASQGGIEIGFHGEEALLMAAQTARGAATLLLRSGQHPEKEIDKVTTPRGCTISGLNEMEHHGFSSAMIKGIVVSAHKADKLLENNNDA